MSSSPGRKSPSPGHAGETACATFANQQFAAQVGQAARESGAFGAHEANRNRVAQSIVQRFYAKRVAEPSAGALHV